MTKSIPSSTTRSHLFACALLLSTLSTASAQPLPSASPSPRPPNFVVIFADDLGYADIGPFGAKGYATPHLDRMAAEGVKLTHFYSAAPVCTPSRAALLTGCYAQRVGLTRVLFPHDRTGLHPDETTLPELLKTRGYATACIGKWHLGHLPPHLPTRHGFDFYFGLPYSNDMSPDPRHNVKPRLTDPPLPLFRNNDVIETEPDQSRLTARYTQEAIQFIESAKDRPFFLYLPHSMPHVPIYASDEFKGKTKRGLYGDVIEELDWSVGQILDTLKRLNLDDHTLVLFTSDNGPWASQGDRAGSAAPLRGAKGTSYEGGTREPFLARWPGRIQPNSVSHQPASTIDFLPTFAKLAGAPLPADRTLDGKDIWPLLSGDPAAQSPHDALYFYTAHALRAVRSGPWKLHLALPGQKDLLPAPELFNLDTDPHEDTDVASQHPDIVARLTTLATRARHDLGDTLTHTQGTTTRPAHTLPAP